MSDTNKALESEQDATDRLRKSNTPDNQKAFRDAHRKVADIELDKTRRRLYEHYRSKAKEANSPQVDMETPDDYRKNILDGD